MLGYKDYSEYLDFLFLNIRALAQGYLISVSSAKNNFEKDSLLEKSKYFLEIFKKNLDLAEERAKQTKDFLGIEYIKTIFGLNKLEWIALLISLLGKISREFRSILEKISQDTIGNIYIISAFRLYYFCFDVKKVKHFYSTLNNINMNLRLFCLDPDGELSQNIFNFILSNAESNSDTSEYTIIFPPKKLNKIVRKEIVNKLAKIIKESKFFYFFLLGEEGCGKKTIVRSTSGILKSPVCIVDLKKCLRREEKFKEILTWAFREATIARGFICFDNFELINNEKYQFLLELVINLANKFSIISFFLSTTAIYNCENIIKEIELMEIYVNELSQEETAIVWKETLDKKNLGGIIDPSELSTLFSFTPGQIISAANCLNGFKAWNGKLDRKILIKCIQNSISINFNGNAHRIPVGKSWEDLIIGPEEKQTMLDACSQIRHRNLVFNEWKINEKVTYGKGLSMLFSGPSGTGKTMAAGVVAGELGLELFRVDISRVISKYIGETEKNLCKIFDEAKKSSVILLFDEMDSLFSVRSDVKDSHDRNANMEISYLLQKMEEYDGVCIMTTNFLENIDKAFFRRITYVIHFALPDANERLKIWENMFKQAPISKIDFVFLSKFEISGGNIKNIAITSAFSAAQDKQIITMKHVLKSMAQELKKQGRTLLATDFGEYAFLLGK